MRSRTPGGRGFVRAAAVCLAALLSLGCWGGAGMAQVNAPKISDAGEKALRALHERTDAVCPAKSAPAQCKVVIAAMTTLDSDLTSGSGTDDRASAALGNMGSLLASALSADRESTRKPLWNAASNELGILEKDVFSVDVAVAQVLVQHAQDRWPDSNPPDMKEAVRILTGLRGSTESAPASGSDSKNDLEASRKKLDAAEGVLRAVPFHGTKEEQSDASDVTRVKDAITKAQKKLPAESRSQSSRDKVDAIDTASAILRGLTSTPASQTLKDYERVHPSALPDTLETDLDDALDYLVPARLGSKIEVDPNAKLDQSCVTGQWDVGACLGRVKKILDDSVAGLPGGEQSQPGDEQNRKKWLVRADHSIARHLQPGEAPKKQWPAVAAAVMSLLTLALLTVLWRKATVAAPTKPETYGPISEAGEAAFTELEQEIGTQAGKYKKLLDENFALQQKKDEAERELAGLKQMQNLPDPEKRSNVDESPTGRGGAEIIAPDGKESSLSETGPGTKLGAGMAGQPQSGTSERQTPVLKEPGEFSGNVRDDYNLAQQKGDDVQERFTKYYNRSFSVSCSNLAERTVVGGKLNFKRNNDFTVFIAVQDSGGRMWLLPQFNVEYRASHDMMDGIFSYPPGTSENLRLEQPGSLVQSDEVWVLETPGVFVNA